MWSWRRQKNARGQSGTAERTLAKYASFRELLTLNNECLELIAGLQEDLQFIPPRREVLDDRVTAIFERVRGVVGALDRLSGLPHSTLVSALESQRSEIERWMAHREEFTRPRLSAWLSETDRSTENEVGAKAAYLGEIRNKLGLPVPDGFVLTTESYRQYCGFPFWQRIRDLTREVDINDLEAVRRVSTMLAEEALALPLPRAIEVAVSGRARTVLKNGGSLAVRSSGVGEGTSHTYAGLFLSILNVPVHEAVDAYRQVIAGRFSERALFYRLSTGLAEVDNALAVLFLLMVPARAAGVMYTRDPGNPKSNGVWITATHGLGLEVASGRMPADMFVVSHARPHRLIESRVSHKDQQLVLQDGGGITMAPVPYDAANEPSIRAEHLYTLAEWGAAIEDHFKQPQDVEWVLDLDDKLWIVQSRPLATAEKTRSRARVKAEPVLSGGRTVYPGRTSGPVFLIGEDQNIADVPDGAIAFIRRPSPEIVEIFPRIAGLIAEWGNIAGHAAALLREFRIPSVFEVSGAFDRFQNGDSVSLDAVQNKLYSGTLWPPHRSHARDGRTRAQAADPISRRLLTLNLLDPSAHNFRQTGCNSAHDVLRYCHEKAIGTMFEANDEEFERGGQHSRKLTTRLPLNVMVLELESGVIAPEADDNHTTPEHVGSRPFQALWKGISHPDVSWRREMPAGIGDLASVLATALTSESNSMRGLGEKSYLLVAREYMNLNSRLAYHYSLIDSSLSDTPANNYISFRFEGGGSTHERRNLRACFLQRCLANYGFQVDRRGDLVNAWLRKAPTDYTAERLDILGRLMACSSQLDMYMGSHEAMNWYVRQFLAGNYSFDRTPELAGSGAS